MDPLFFRNSCASFFQGFQRILLFSGIPGNFFFFSASRKSFFFSGIPENPFSRDSKESFFRDSKESFFVPGIPGFFFFFRDSRKSFFKKLFQGILFFFQAFQRILFFSGILVDPFFIRDFCESFFFRDSRKSSFQGFQRIFFFFRDPKQSFFFFFSDSRKSLFFPQGFNGILFFPRHSNQSFFPQGFQGILHSHVQEVTPLQKNSWPFLSNLLSKHKTPSGFSGCSRIHHFGMNLCLFCQIFAKFHPKKLRIALASKRTQKTPQGFFFRPEFSLPGVSAPPL